jgi:elongation factor P--(R)-beta-lysine ligase
MLALCVMEPIYSLARFRHMQPAPPFLLGGEFRRFDQRCFLQDAVQRLELHGPDDLYSELINGDLIVVRVHFANRESIQCESCAKLVSPSAERPTIKGNHPRGFASFVRDIRDFLVKRGLEEVFTPSLVRCPGLEPYLEPFATVVTKGREQRTAYLPTSPEIHLKKALALGFTDIFEIKNCFRRGEFSPHHENEFTMLEWYRGFADLHLIEEDLQQLVKECGGPPLSKTSFAELFNDLLSFQLTPETKGLELRALCESQGISTLENDSFNDLFHRVFLEKIEPRLAERGPMIIRHFPPSQAALARLTSDGWSDRFEFYWQGFEIANAFNEVNDPMEQAQRWQAERFERRHVGTSDVPEDPDLIMAQKWGMPPSGGIALGLERLYMALYGVSEIRELKLFSTDSLFN